MDLSKYIKENARCEKILKIEDRKYNHWLKAVSAFANTDGGTLLFGVYCDEVLVGLENCKEDSEIIAEMIRTKIEPRVNIQLDTITEDNKDFILVHIESGKKTPYYLKDGKFKTAYLRINGKNIPATRFKLEELYLKGMNISFDTINSKAHRRYFSFTDLSGHYRKRTGEKLKDKDLYSFGLINHVNELSNAGVLFANEYEIEHYKIICTSWKGIDKQSENTRKHFEREYGGGLTALLDNAIDFIKVHAKRTFRKGAKNTEYPEVAVTEALVNALVHRDYRITDDFIRIDLYHDRMEIYSPGAMPSEELVQDLDPYDIPSFRRNLIISDVFGRMNLMERRGNGLRKIIEAYQKDERYADELKPVFESTDSSFLVKLYNFNYKKSKGNDRKKMS